MVKRNSNRNRNRRPPNFPFPAPSPPNHPRQQRGPNNQEAVNYYGGPNHRQHQRWNWHGRYRDPQVVENGPNHGRGNGTGNTRGNRYPHSRGPYRAVRPHSQLHSTCTDCGAAMGGTHENCDIEIMSGEVEAECEVCVRHAQWRGELREALRRWVGEMQGFEGMLEVEREGDTEGEGRMDWQAENTVWIRYVERRAPCVRFKEGFMGKWGEEWGGMNKEVTPPCTPESMRFGMV